MEPRSMVKRQTVCNMNTDLARDDVSFLKNYVRFKMAEQANVSIDQISRAL
jgi:hypothetical protein